MDVLSSIPEWESLHLVCKSLWTDWWPSLNRSMQIQIQLLTIAHYMIQLIDWLATQVAFRLGFRRTMHLAAMIAMRQGLASQSVAEKGPRNKGGYHCYNHQKGGIFTSRNGDFKHIYLVAGLFQLKNRPFQSMSGTSTHWIQVSGACSPAVETRSHMRLVRGKRVVPLLKHGEGDPTGESPQFQVIFSGADGADCQSWSCLWDCRTESCV